MVARQSQTGLRELPICALIRLSLKRLTILFSARQKLSVVVEPPEEKLSELLLLLPLSLLPELLAMLATALATFTMVPRALPQPPKPDPPLLGEP